MLGQARVETRKLVWETGLYLVENSDSRVLILVPSWILGLRGKGGRVHWASLLRAINRDLTVSWVNQRI